MPAARRSAGETIRREALRSTAPGTVAGVGGLLLAGTLPYVRSAPNTGTGMAGLYLLLGEAIPLGAVVVAPPIMDQLGILD